MGKKRGKDKSSREDDDIELTGPSCRHIKKGADQALLKKLHEISDWTSCQDCQQHERKENASATLPQDSEEDKENIPVWMCLKCGHRGCGRTSENQHAIKHYQTPRSDPHCLVVSLDNWNVWCYLCDEEVQYSRTGHLAQLLTSLKKQTSVDPVKGEQKRVKEEDSFSKAEQNTETLKAEETEDKENKDQEMINGKKENVVKSQRSDTTDKKGGVPVKGLSNMGNTCFFNAVIQSLSQTRLLRQTLNKVAEENRSINITPSVSVELEPIAVQLDQPGPLTLAMCQLLNEIQESKKSVVTPRELFSQVCKKAARFKGFQQQDSQELLRYLLDGMRTEELKRMVSGITEVLKQSTKSTDAEQLKTVVKEYEKQGFPNNFVDQVFGGEMTSTIMCQSCKTVSVVTEVFLDLSLPVSDEAYRKKNQKKGVQKSSESSQDGRNSPTLTSTKEDTPTAAGSKYQQKKAKKQAKKQAKQQKRQQKFEERVTLESLTSPSRTEVEKADPAADEETSDARSADTDTREDTPDSCDAEQPEKEKEENEETVTDEPSAAASSDSNRFTVLSEEQQPPKDASLDGDRTSDVDEEGEQHTALMSDMEKVTLDDAFIDDSNDSEQGMETEDEPELKEYTVVNQDPELAFHTLAARTAPEKQECSVHSSLLQFTEVEILTQNNSLLCVTCTKRQQNQGKAGGSQKNIYTDALKQMLISSPPPVLTLHLKRFQQSAYSICKVNRHVQFPLILDLAPFCSLKCKNVTEGGTQILYSLYGIVEHSGTMRSGHYTAYVKVQPHHKASSNGLSEEGDAEPPKGSWFHISDTSIQPVSESKVQSCQAYLLFYERIF
ncbi:ubiquitin carboxyl-terminal hydrolase 16 [Betta splendens]|uniref:Ubiquitin carboxyl-terminal hydrolase 16 n=1 Tax=Betta splendens TaxID=158456 RepID=A0A6P7P502_BETSP|nr:ubiquitin carboxyl-terminal hydrolase 16 [Betta splendens]